MPFILSTGFEIFVLSISFDLTTEAIRIWLCNTSQGQTERQVSMLNELWMLFIHVFVIS